MLFNKRRSNLASSARTTRRARVVRRPSVEVLEGRALLADFISFGGHYYAATDGPVTWQQAENQAVKLGGHLAAITSQAEQNFLTSNFAVKEDIWIGLSDHAKKGRLAWTTGERVGYTAYYPGEPNNLGGAEDFVQMNLGSGLWNDNTGTAKERGIIELNHPPASAAKSDADNFTFSFVTKSNKAVIEYDSRGSIKDPTDKRASYYFHVAVKIDVQGTVKPNQGAPLVVRIYWANQSGIIGGINGYAARLSKPFVYNGKNEQIIDLYRSPLSTPQPPNATQLIAVIDPDLANPLGNFKAKATIGIVRHNTVFKDLTDKKVGTFIQKNIVDANLLASELKVPVMYILGLSGQETGYGTSNIALNAHNYFGLNANASGRTGTYTTSENVKVAKFPASDGFLASGQSFVHDFGYLVHGQTSEDMFVSNLVPKFNTGVKATGGNPKFVPTVKDAITSINNRIDRIYYYTT